MHQFRQFANLIQRVIQKFPKPIHLLYVVAALVPISYLLDFIEIYGENLPTSDSASRSIYVAVAAKTGTFKLSDLFTSYSGHIAITSQLVTYLTTKLTSWNLTVEIVVVLVIAIVNFVLLMGLVYYTETRALPLIIFPAAVLFFAIQNNVNWLSGYNGIAWFGTQLWILIALTGIWFGHRTWWGFAFATSFAVLATFSAGSGISVWGVLLLAMVLSGIRRPFLYVGWLLVTLIFMATYIVLAGIQLGDASGSGTTINLSDMKAIWEFFLAYLGNMFSSQNLQHARRVGLIALSLAALNLITLTVFERNWRFLRIWLPISAYSLMTASLAALARSGDAYSPIDGWYIVSTLYFWIGLLLSSVLIVLRASSRYQWWQYSVALVNIVCWAIWATMFIPSNIQTLERQVEEQVRILNEPCHLKYIYTQPQTPADCFIWTPETINVISYHGLSMFAHYQPTKILDGHHQSGVPVLVEGSNAWANFNIDKWLLDDIPEHDKIHIAPDMVQSDGFGYPITFEPTFQNAEALYQNIGIPSSFWYIRPETTNTILEDYLLRLRSDEYVETTFKYREDEDASFIISRYELMDSFNDLGPYRFGDDIFLSASVPISDTLEVCEPIFVKTLWYGNQPTPVPYSVTYNLVDQNSQTVARSDAQLAYVSSNEWQSEQLYLDERQLAVPCDLMDGTYTIQVGIYDWRDGIRLPVYEGDEATGYDLVTIQSVQIKR